MEQKNNSNDYYKALNYFIQGIFYIVERIFKKNSTKIYSGIIVSNNNNGQWNVKYNGEVHAIPSYGSISPNVNDIVKVIIPQGNQNLAFFF